MRILSRIFCGLLFAVTLLFAGVAPSFAAVQFANPTECQKAGFTWDYADEQCCWALYVDPEGKNNLCINDQNNAFANACKGIEAGYIDPNGVVHCCPEDTDPDTENHKCVCKNGGVLDIATGKCKFALVRVSDWCDFWNKEYGKGYFLNYLLGLNYGSLNNYRSQHTCSDVINTVGDGSVVWDGESCKCSCANPSLTFNPAAADTCVEEGKDCEDICVDLSFGQKEACPAGQRYYLINDEWQCCFFYDPDSGTCIDTTQEWLDYINNTLGFESGGGYINAEGLPMECPQEDEEVGVNKETGLCTCLEGGWFDVTTGQCWSSLSMWSYRDFDTTYNAWPSVLFYIQKNWSSVPFSLPATQHGWLEKNGAQVFDSNGDYVYTNLPVTTPATTPYVMLDTNGFYSVPSIYTNAYIALTLNGNSGSPSSQVLKYPLAYAPGAPNPTRTGYNFTGWYTSTASNATQKDITRLPLSTPDSTFYAHWTVKTYNVNLNKNSNVAANGTTSVTATYGENMPTPITLPTRDGYSFTGYYDTSNASGGTKYYNADGTSARTWNKDQNNFTLYARWEQDSVSITLNKNGGTGTCGGASGTTSGTLSCPGGTCTLPQYFNGCSMTKSGKIFVGWTTTAPSASNSYLDTANYEAQALNATVTNVTNGTTYYAIWRTPTCSATNGTSSLSSITDNTPYCDVTCDTGYLMSGIYQGGEGTSTLSHACYAACVAVCWNGNGATSGSPDPNGCRDWGDWCYDQTPTHPLHTYGTLVGPDSSTGFAKWRCQVGRESAFGVGADCGDFSSGQTMTTTQLNNMITASTQPGGYRTLWACWNYNISYDYGDAGNSAVAAVNSSAQPDHYNNCDGVTVGGTNADDKPTWPGSGKVFLGWCDNNNGTLTNCAATRGLDPGTTGAKTYTASWGNGTTTTVTLDKNSGSGGSSYIYTLQNGGAYLDSTHNNSMSTSANNLTIPTMNGSDAFLGYYTAASGGDKIIDANGFVTSDGLVWLKARDSNTTIYAQWSQSCHVVQVDNSTYCGGGGVPRLYYSYYSNGAYINMYSDATCSTSIDSIPNNPELIVKEHSQYQNHSVLYTNQAGNSNWVAFTTNNKALIPNGDWHYAGVGTWSPWYARCACDTGYQGYGTYAANNPCAEGITITLDKNGGSGGSDYVYTRKGNASTGGVFTDSGRTTAMGTNGTNPITAPTRTNYSFLGYYDDDNDGVQMISGGTPVILGNGLNRGRSYGAADVGKTWYAHWQGDQYTVTYACGDGATGTPPSSTTVRYGSGFTPSSTPGGCTKAGYELSGWTVSNTNPTETKTPGTQFTWEYTENKTLTAVWTAATYILTLTDSHESSNTRSLFEIYGVRWASNNQGTPGSSSITTVPMPVRSGYTFRGYYTTDQSDVDSNVSSTTGFRMKTNLAAIHGCTGTNCNTTLTQNTEWFAAWADDCDMTGNGTCTLTIGDSGQVTYTTSCDDANGYTLSGNATSTPTCTANTYTVTLDANGGSGGTETVTATFGAAMPAATMPTRTNWNFAGYYDTNAATGGNQYYTSDGSSARSWDKTAATTLYARWTQNSITCDPGEFYDASEADCAQCPAGSYCPGGTFSGDADDGINACPTGYTSDAGQDAQTDCYIMCGPGTYKSSNTATSCANVGANYWGPGGKAYYGSKLSRRECGRITGIDGVEKHMQTTGSGIGANELGDCGLALHIGTDVLRLRSSKKTTPSLNFNYNGTSGADLFLNLSTNASPMTSTKNFKMNYSGNLYFGCDDTTCVQTVTYNCGTGSGTPPSSTTAQYGSVFTPSATSGGCTKSGYTLSGWTVSNTNPAEIKEPGVQFTWRYTENKTLTAAWTEN